MTDLLSRRREIRSLTGLRGIAALWVVVHHALYIARPRGPFWTLIYHGYLAVDLFFVLSGYVIAMNYAERSELRIHLGDVVAFLCKRFARTYPLYAVATLASGLVLYYFGIRPWANPSDICGAGAL